MLLSIALLFFASRSDPRIHDQSGEKSAFLDIIQEMLVGFGRNASELHENAIEVPGIRTM